ncbi:MAG TPA: serine/threonine-protein kinase, partial [Minicystis sp.]|nr:serine/threonine-protein kinase [Minicystis sp.]
MADLEAAAEKRVGETFAGYRLERVLGIGGMASVFLGRRQDGAAAALKLLHAPLNAVDEVKVRFLREGSIGEQLGAATQMPGLPRVYASGVAPDGTAYLVMELLAGEPLFDRMARAGRLSVPEVLSIAEEVLDVLVVAHAHGVVHRDMKPENLHVLPDGRIKVLDFGIARVLEAVPSSIQGLPEMTATRTGITIGTTEYISPEQATGIVKDIDGRTDLFGLGATMFRLLSGQTVHGDLPLAEMLIAAATKQVAPLRSVARDVPHDVCAIVDIALAFDKTRRYPDADTMRRDVRAARAGLHPPYARAVEDGRLAQGAPLGAAV